ncbi:hypothetical protein P3W85_29425 [Cupriavidus basilensis]|uniref:Transmembrane protein n=1 Tax=Cupriavidus basilensis TaxID=68895 RepID=A0ABT6AWP2_9BURK|nr:hypothetical protein [Cupriavidus basilensis]MDF3837044.1 hypothetical protein [Cupriavidus basilensis]
MKVTCKRAGITLYRVGAAVALLLAASAGYPQSPGMAQLLSGAGKANSREGGGRNERERHGQDEARARGKYRGEREVTERLPRGSAHDRLSPDERRKLRQNLYELGREMYQGG